MNNIKKVLNGLAGVNKSSLDDGKVELWEVPYFKLKIAWNTKVFTIVYEDKSSTTGTSNVNHVFKDGNVDLSLIEFYDMILEVSKGMQNSQLAGVGNDYTEQDIRDSKELADLLVAKVLNLIEMFYEKGMIEGELSKLKDDEIYLLIKITEENGYTIQGYTRDDFKARKFLSTASFMKDYNKDEYPKYTYKVLKEYE